MSIAQRAQLTLLCLPCAGGSASMYLRWQRSLPHGVRLVPVELPGRGTRMSEPFVEDYDALVTQLCREHERYCHGRYVLLGHSMGGLLAHGMARLWRSQAQALPEALLISASPAPARRNPRDFIDKNSDESLLAELRKQGGTPVEVFESPEMLQITLSTLRADYRVCAGYEYRPDSALNLPVHVFAGRQDDIEVDRILAWRDETGAGFSVRWFDGGHFFIRHHEAAFLAALSRTLMDEPQRRISASAANG